MSLFLETGLFLLLSYVVVLLFFYTIQQRLLFHPTTGRYQPEPGEKAEPYTLQRGTIQLRGWLVNPGFARRRLILYYGGNGENIFHNIDEFADIQAATLFVAYRGYSGSDGEPGEAALFADALAVIDDITARYNPQQLFVMGRSLGAFCYGAEPGQRRRLLCCGKTADNRRYSCYPFCQHQPAGKGSLSVAAGFPAAKA